MIFSYERCKRAGFSASSSTLALQGSPSGSIVSPLIRKPLRFPVDNDLFYGRRNDAGSGAGVCPGYNGECFFCWRGCSADAFSACSRDLFFDYQLVIGQFVSIYQQNTTFAAYSRGRVYRLSRTMSMRSMVAFTTFPVVLFLLFAVVCCSKGAAKCLCAERICFSRNLS